MSISFPIFVGVLVLVAIASVVLAPRSRTIGSFFSGEDGDGRAPGVFTLTFSQVTTWIFARSLLNAGILGYLFGIAGALAYTAYYGSFLTGAVIVDRLRSDHRADGVQEFLRRRFGGAGPACFNTVVSLRLLSEVFANLLVVGIVFESAGPWAADGAILAVAGVALAYSMTGGLQASLRTDVLQTGLLLVIIAVPVVLMAGHDAFAVGDLLASSPELRSPGWVLLVVAFLQIPSYPLHDPVMMDRSFLADRRTTRRSLVYAFGLASTLIFGFGLLGVFAGLHAGDAGRSWADWSRCSGRRPCSLSGSLWCCRLPRRWTRPSPASRNSSCWIWTSARGDCVTGASPWLGLRSADWRSYIWGPTTSLRRWPSAAPRLCF